MSDNILEAIMSDLSVYYEQKPGYINKQSEALVSEAFYRRKRNNYTWIYVRTKTNDEIINELKEIINYKGSIDGVETEENDAESEQCEKISGDDFVHNVGKFIAEKYIAENDITSNVVTTYDKIIEQINSLELKYDVKQNLILEFQNGNIDILEKYVDKELLNKYKIGK